MSIFFKNVLNCKLSGSHKCVYTDSVSMPLSIALLCPKVLFNEL